MVNVLLFDEEGNCSTHDPDQPTSASGGKAKALQTCAPSPK